MTGTIANDRLGDRGLSVDLKLGLDLQIGASAAPFLISTRSLLRLDNPSVRELYAYLKSVGMCPV